MIKHDICTIEKVGAPSLIRVCVIWIAEVGYKTWQRFLQLQHLRHTIEHKPIVIVSLWFCQSMSDELTYQRQVLNWLLQLEIEGGYEVEVKVDGLSVYFEVFYCFILSKITLEKLCQIAQSFLVFLQANLFEPIH